MNKVFTFVLFEIECDGENLGDGAFSSIVRKDVHKLMENTLLIVWHMVAPRCSPLAVAEAHQCS